MEEVEPCYQYENAQNIQYAQNAKDEECQECDENQKNQEMSLNILHAKMDS